MIIFQGIKTNLIPYALCQFKVCLSIFVYYIYLLIKSIFRLGKPLAPITILDPYSAFLQSALVIYSAKWPLQYVHPMVLSIINIEVEDKS